MYFSLFGNCQAQALRWLLKQSDEFCSNFEEIEVSASYMMNKDDAAIFSKEVIPKLDVLLMQPHGGNISMYHDHCFIRERCKENNVQIITFPQIYFSIYNPWEKQIDAVDNDIFDDCIRYTDCFMSSAIVNGLSESEFLSESKSLTAEKNKYIMTEQNNCFSYLNEIENKRGCDIKLFEFIMDNFKGQCLMHNINHPKSELMQRIAHEVLQLLGINFKPDPVDLFPNHNTLIYPFVADLQGIKFFSSDHDISERYQKYLNFFQTLSLTDYAKFLRLLRPFQLQL